MVRRSLLLPIVILAVLRAVAFAELISPKIELDSTQYDFGKVTQGEVVEHTFTIKNSGKKILRIIRVTPSCGCTVAKIKKTLLAPNETASLKVRFDTEGFMGNKVKTVTIYSNDPDSQVVVLTIKGVVLSDLETEPDRLQFLNIKRGQIVSKVIKAKIRDGSKAKIVGIVSNSPYIDVKEISRKNGARNLEVSLKADFKGKSFKGRVTIYLRKRYRWAINIPVLATVEG
ncbi:MAG: DUF1573 domain-containing protein [Candidatus Dadabacteria bacterium]|nr:MAG: DUF1573 domain-containing protein [Candidatus Dadabacteria bacterium]